jgi:hypothetical protein
MGIASAKRLLACASHLIILDQSALPSFWDLATDYELERITATNPMKLQEKQRLRPSVCHGILAHSSLEGLSSCGNYCFVFLLSTLMFDFVKFAIMFGSCIGIQNPLKFRK